MPEENSVNKYTCKDCKRSSVIKHIDAGTTPFMLTCPKCNGDMYSCFYDCDQSATPDLYWFKPINDKQIEKQIKWELRFLRAEGLVSPENAMELQKRHVDDGGVILGPDIETIEKWGKE